MLKCKCSGNVFNLGTGAVVLREHKRLHKTSYLTGTTFTDRRRWKAKVTSAESEKAKHYKVTMGYEK